MFLRCSTGRLKKNILTQFAKLFTYVFKHYSSNSLKYKNAGSETKNHLRQMDFFKINSNAKQQTPHSHINADKHTVLCVKG